MSDYDCYCDDGEAADFYHLTTPKALKTHRCKECGHGIFPGEKYESVRALFDGSIGVYKTCSRCTALREHLKAHVRCFCWMHGSMLEDARLTIEHLPTAAVGSWLLFELGRMAVAIRRAPMLPKPNTLPSH